MEFPMKPVESRGVRLEEIPKALQHTIGARFLVSQAFSESNPSNYTVVAMFLFEADALQFYHDRVEKNTAYEIGEGGY